MKLRFTILVAFITQVALNQEVSLPAITPNVYENTKKIINSINLPFFCDFSQQYQINYFDNEGVSITYTLSSSPYSIGLATFDAIDKNGNFYQSDYNQITKADILTSKPINLNYPPNQNIYFSFKYTNGGYLDSPDANDSLVLQFYDAYNNKWITVWASSNKLNNTWETVMIPIVSPNFLTSQFKFRFFNYISIATPSPSPSFISNCDFWFIDYIYINKNRNSQDTTFRDLAFVTPPLIKLDDYQTIPLQHYIENKEKINHSIYFELKNNDKIIRQIDSLNLVINEVNGTDNLKLYFGSYALLPNILSKINRQNLNYRLNPTSNSSEYNFKLYLKTDFYDSICNNTVSILKQISNYYSYDDGSAENAYGIYGEGSIGSYFAQKYYTYKKDKLIGVAVYFNKPFKSSIAPYFKPIVWNISASGLPASIIYEPYEPFVVNIDSLNTFQHFFFDKEVEVSDTFFVGFEKIEEQLENIGLDITSSKKNYKYILINNGQWQNSKISGIAMIRPIFGSLPKKDTSNSYDVKIYPNPANNYINLEKIPDMVYIYDLKGNLYKALSPSSSAIDISDFPKGIYLLKMIFEKETVIKKLIKN